MAFEIGKYILSLSSYKYAISILELFSTIILYGYVTLKLVLLILIKCPEVKLILKLPKLAFILSFFLNSQGNPKVSG